MWKTVGKNRALAIVLVLGAGLVWLALSAKLPGFFGANDVAEESIAADTDFPVVLRIKGGVLEVASVSGKRNFPQAKDPQILGQAFTYCRERASWTAPYKITYRVDVGEVWKLRAVDGRLIARVPELKPSLPVAIDTSRTKPGAKESCWFVPDLGTREKAFAQISPLLADLANSKKTKDFARPAARKTIKEFLRNWAFAQKSYPNLPPDAPITVIFPGE